MKKLKLNLDDLKVESFATTPDTHMNEGTVEGYITPWTDLCEYTERCGTMGVTCRSCTCEISEK